jgi:hypothetical protein
MGKVTYVTWAWVRAVERHLSSRIAFDNARNAAMTLRHRREKIANANGIKVPPANHAAAHRDRTQCAQQAETY